MVITKENLMDIIAYYMQDHDIDYLSVKASESTDKSKIIMSINEDLEFDDD
jgi:hypothetical protein